MKNNGITISGLIFLLVFAVIIGVIYFAVVSKVNSSRVQVCSSNLKAIGAAMSEYANDYGAYPNAGGKGAFWSEKLGWNFDADMAEYMKPEYAGQPLAVRTSTNFYLLVRYYEILPENFTCPASDDEVFSYPSIYKNFRSLWDFGDTPFDNCSYSVQRPFGDFPARPDWRGDKPLAADRSPYFDKSGEAVDTLSDNSRNHEGKNQNILFNDISIERFDSSDAGLGGDNIYKFGEGNVPELRDEDTDAFNDNDSFLVM